MLPLRRTFIATKNDQYQVLGGDERELAESLSDDGYLVLEYSLLGRLVRDEKGNPKVIRYSGGTT